MQLNSYNIFNNRQERGSNDLRSSGYSGYSRYSRCLICAI